jgi:hypothetical protein
VRQGGARCSGCPRNGGTRREASQESFRRVEDLLLLFATSPESGLLQGTLTHLPLSGLVTGHAVGQEPGQDGSPQS